MIIKNYIHSELLHKLLWVIFLLILIFASSRFIGFLSDAADGSLPSDIVFLMLGYKILASLPKILSISILISVLLVYSRMANDNELSILKASGLCSLFHVKVLMHFTSLLCVFIAILTLFVAPWAEKKMHVLKKIAKQEADISVVKPAQFREFSKGERIVYVQNVSDDKKSMEDVFLQEYKEEKLGVLKSNKAYFYTDPKLGNKYIIFKDGYRFINKAQLLDHKIVQYEKYAVLMKPAKVDFGLRDSALSTSDIINSDNPTYKAEFQWRISLVISCFLLPFLAVFLYQSYSRERRYMPFIISILIYLIYSNLLSIAQSLLKKETIPSVIGIWWVHLLLIGVLLFLYYWPRFLFGRKVISL